VSRQKRGRDRRCTYITFTVNIAQDGEDTIKKYQMQASQPSTQRIMPGPHSSHSNSSRTRTWRIFGEPSSSGSGRRVKTTICVICGCRRHCRRTSLPMKPVAPVNMSFISLSNALRSLFMRKFGGKRRKKGKENGKRLTKAEERCKGEGV
jgi:hypothetical protein